MEVGVDGSSIGLLKWQNLFQLINTTGIMKVFYRNNKLIYGVNNKQGRAEETIKQTINTNTKT